MIRVAQAKPEGFDISLIRADGGTQSRADLYQDVVNDYATAMGEGAEFPPVVLFYDGKEHWLADGFHRYQACQQLGLVEIEVDIRQGTRRDAILYSVGANETHGLRRTNDDKRRAVLTLLNDAEWTKWSDREIGRRCLVHHETVGRIRNSFTGENASERTYTTKHGTVASMNTSAIGKAAPQNTEQDMETTQAVNGAARRGPRYTIVDGMDFAQMARAGLAREAKGEIAEAVAKSLGVGAQAYRQACDVVFLADRGGYRPSDQKIVDRAMRVLVDDQMPTGAREIINPVAARVWGSGSLHARPRPTREPSRVEQFEHALGVITQTCFSAAEMDLPYLSVDAAMKAAKKIRKARQHLQSLLARIEEIHK